jgi:hypothetical protein
MSTGHDHRAKALDGIVAAIEDHPFAGSSVNQCVFSYLLLVGDEQISKSAITDFGRFGTYDDERPRRDEGDAPDVVFHPVRCTPVYTGQWYLRGSPKFFEIGAGIGQQPAAVSEKYGRINAQRWHELGMIHWLTASAISPIKRLLVFNSRQHIPRRLQEALPLHEQAPIHNPELYKSSSKASTSLRLATQKRGDLQSIINVDLHHSVREALKGQHVMSFSSLTCIGNWQGTCPHGRRQTARPAPPYNPPAHLTCSPWRAAASAASQHVRLLDVQ